MMTDEKLKRAENIKSSIKCMEDMFYFIGLPYPTFLDRNCRELCWINLDEVTLKGLKEVMREYLTKRIDELEKEFKEL